MSATLIGNALENFFKEVVTPHEWATSIRKYNMEVMEMHLRQIMDNGGAINDIAAVIEGVYQTNAIAELIDPYLDDLEYFKNKK